MLLTVMEAGCIASSPGVQEAPQGRRVCVLRGGAVSGRNLSHKIPYEIDSPPKGISRMADTALIVANNLSHNVVAHIEAAKNSL